MKKTLILLLSLFTVFGLLGCEPEGDDDNRPTASGPIPGWDDPVYCNAMGYTYNSDDLVYELVWSDEFDGDSLDLTKWTPKTNSGNSNNDYSEDLQDEIYYCNSMFLHIGHVLVGIHC